MWHVNWKPVWMWLACMFLIFGVPVALKWMMQDPGMKYDCQISEISPDVPLEVRERCRHANSKTL